MRFWPHKRWKQIMLILVLILVSSSARVAVGAFAVLLLSASREVVSGIDVINANGGKTALIVYQPGFSSFPRDISYAFADGLASSGWHVEITTASTQTPSDLSKYNLLMLGARAQNTSFSEFHGCSRVLRHITFHRARCISQKTQFDRVIN